MSFNPKLDKDCEDLKASNADILTRITSVKWLNIHTIADEKKHYLTILICLSDANSAEQCICEQVWYRFRKHQTEKG